LGIPCEYLPSLPDPTTESHWSAQIKTWVPNALKIAHLARKWQAVIVHSNTPRASYHGGLGARLSKVKAVTHVHDSFNLPYRSSLKTKLLMSLTDETITVSQAVTRAILDLAPYLAPQINTVYNGLDIAAYRSVQPANLYKLWGIPSNRLIIGNASAVRPLKGQDVLIEAFRLLNQTHKNTHLLIVGGGQGQKEWLSYEQQLHAQIYKHHLQGFITFTGWQENVWPLIRSMDIFAHVPVQPDSLPTSVLHASALSRAIVASNIGGIPEIILNKSTGLLVPPSDVFTLYKTLELLVNDQSTRYILGQQAQVHFQQRFSFDQMQQELGRVYRKVL